MISEGREASSIREGGVDIYRFYLSFIISGGVGGGGGGTGGGQDRKEGAYDGDYRYEIDGKDDLVLKRGAMLLEGASWEAALP